MLFWPELVLRFAMTNSITKRNPPYISPPVLHSAWDWLKKSTMRLNPRKNLAIRILYMIFWGSVWGF